MDGYILLAIMAIVFIPFGLWGLDDGKKRRR
jgi:hypothetical protein